MTGQRTSQRRGGFTLIEVLVASLIIGVCFVAMLGSMESGTRANRKTADRSRAQYLIDEVREWTLRLPFTDPDAADAGKEPGSDGGDPLNWVDDLDDLMNQTYGPPISSLPAYATGSNKIGTRLTDMTGWEQTIVLTWVDEGDLSAVADGASNVIRVECQVYYEDEFILSDSWLITNAE